MRWLAKEAVSEGSSTVMVQGCRAQRGGNRWEWMGQGSERRENGEIEGLEECERGRKEGGTSEIFSRVIRKKRKRSVQGGPCTV